MDDLVRSVLNAEEPKETKISVEWIYLKTAGKAICGTHKIETEWSIIVKELDTGDFLEIPKNNIHMIRQGSLTRMSGL